MILNAFAEEMNQTAILESAKKIYDPVSGQYTKGITVEKSVPCAYYTGRSAENLVGDRFKTIVDGVLIITPLSLEGYIINNSDTVSIENEDYEVILADDVMFQGEVLVVGVKRK